MSPAPTPPQYVPPRMQFIYSGWRADLAREAPAAPPGARQLVAMLLTDQRFGADQLFATADALRQAALHASWGTPEQVPSLLKLAELLGENATDRVASTQWHRVA